MAKRTRFPFLKPSTIAFWREARRVPGFSFFDWLHGYVYARWPYLYIGIGTGEHPLTRYLLPVWHLVTRIFKPELSGDSSNGRSAFADSYHGKVLLPEAAKNLVKVDRDVRIGDLERVIPYNSAREIVLKNPDHIVVLECPCRASRTNPCQPLDVCLIIGEPFASFMLEHNPRKARQITSEEAVAILEAEHQRGHVHHAFFKDAMLGRFYAICNCCACCCGAMQAMRNGTPMLASSGYVCKIYQERCVGCGECVKYCQFGALALLNGTVSIEEEKCLGCGVCLSKCEQEAHYLVRDPRRGEPLEINNLLVSN